MVPTTSWDTDLAQAFLALAHELPDYREILRVLSQGFEESLPNVLLFGSREGLPHTLLWDAMVHRKFGAFHRNTCVWNKLWTYHETPFFFDIDLAHPNQPKDITSLSEFLKEIVVHTCMHASRHVFFLRNVDHVCARSGASMLRVMLERYSGTAWFVCSTYKVGALEPPVRSRFFMLRIPHPSYKDIERIFEQMGKHVPEVCTKHQVRNLSLAMFLSSVESAQDKLPHSFEDLCLFYCPFLIEAIRERKTIPSVEDVRALTQKLVVHGYTFAEIASDLVRASCVKPDFITFAAQVDHMCSLTERYRKSLFIEWLLSAAFYGISTPTLSI